MKNKTRHIILAEQFQNTIQKWQKEAKTFHECTTSHFRDFRQILQYKVAG